LLCQVLILVFVGWLALGPEARAACPSTPVNWAAQDCAVDGVPVCTATGDTWECDVSSSGSDAEVNTVGTGGKLYSFGTHDGELFCCESPGNVDFELVETYGSEHDDLLTFIFAPASLELAEFTGVVMVATIYGGDGNDTIKGSNRDSPAYYFETLRGQDGIDNIQGNGGNDYLYGGQAGDICDGGPGDDTIYGEGGNDTLDGNSGSDHIYGGNDNDTIRGGPGNDFLYGEAGDDRIGGGDDNDTIDGGTGGDVMCGDAESGGDGDQIFDGTETSAVTPKNLIWGANSVDELYCYATNTETDASSDDVLASCNPVLTSKPGQCP
jgi:Ca2+-binding RTX toxin-like protein